VRCDKVEDMLDTQTGTTQASTQPTTQPQHKYAQLGRDAGLSRTQVFRVLKGDRQPSWTAACRMADALGISMDALRAMLANCKDQAPTI